MNSFRKMGTHILFEAKKLQEHSESQIKRKEPGIQKLAKKYNDICAELENMIKRKESPRGACAPHRIATDGLFKLDVDDDIWQDVGLDDMDLSSGREIPQWLGDEGVRKGIKSLLELDRCQEELQRLSHERSAMQEWFAEEWKCVVKAMQSEQNEDVIYQLELHAYNLACLCNTWQDKVRLVIPHKTMDSSWGPTVEELAQTRKWELSEMTMENEIDGEEEDESDDDEDQEEDGEEQELLEAVEMVALSDEFRNSYMQ